MKADFDLADDGSVSSLRGGARFGAGRKPLGYEKPEVTKDYEKAKARKEVALADMHELQFKIKSGEYVSRDAVREATATVLASLAQSLRSLPDNLERRFSLPADVAEEVEKVIDATLADVSAGLAMFTVENVDA